MFGDLGMQLIECLWLGSTGSIFHEQLTDIQSNIAPQMDLTYRKEELLTKQGQSVLKCKVLGLKLLLFHV